MNFKTLNKIIVPLFTTLLLLISIWFVTVIITGSKNYYHYQFNKNNTVEGLSWYTSDGEYIKYNEEDLDKIINQIVDYLFDKEESMQVVINDKNVFSNQALNHMSDVKQLYKNWTIVTIIFIILLIPCVLYLIKHFKEVKNVLFKYSMITYLIIGILLLIISLFMIIDFDWTFTNFHHILFPNPDSFKDAFFGTISNYDELPYINNLLLIKVLSLDVFLDAAWIIVAYIIFIMLLWTLFTVKFKKKKSED